MLLDFAKCSLGTRHVQWHATAMTVQLAGNEDTSATVSNLIGITA